MSDPARLAERLANRRRLARIAILFEAIWPAIWPALAVIGVFLCLALLGLPPQLPGWAHLTLLVTFAAAFFVLLYRGLRGVRLPDDSAADRRLETGSGLVHRPLSVLTDTPAADDETSQALWRAHAARAAAQITRLRVGIPRPGLARRDPKAFRYALLLSLIACLTIANTDALPRLYAALTPSLPATPGAPATQLQAWITPPAYTQVAPIFLKSEGGDISVPIGSHLTVNVSGGHGMPSLALDDKSRPFAALDGDSYQIETDLRHGGLLTVRRAGELLAGWTLTVIADQPPTVAWGENPGRQRGSQETRLPWQANDDYGVVNLQAELRLRDRPDAPPLIIQLPLPNGNVKAGHGVSQPDLTANPWAGLPVTGRLVGRDAAGQTGTSADVGFELAERPFHNPIARALIAARKTLSIHPDDRTQALAALDALMQQPQAFGDDLGAFANLSAIYYGLVWNHTATAVPEAQDTMWQLALHMEEGQTEQTARALDRARQAARDAMDKARQQPSAAARQELAKKLEELRQAIDRYIQALTQEAQRNNSLVPFDPNAMKMSDQELRRLTEQAEQAAKEGRMADAQQQMTQLERMLDQLRNIRTQGQQGRQANSRQQRGQQQQGVVQDLIARQGGLLDHSTQRAEAQPQAADPTHQREADRRVQQALRRALGELMQQFADLTGQVSPGLGQADQAMRDAIGQLGQGDDGAASQAQQQAIEALQKGNQEMAQAMARMGLQPGQGQGNGDEDGQGEAMGMAMPGGQGGDGRGYGSMPGSPGQADPNGRDPLGRFNEGSATDDADVALPENREHLRTQAIQDELRRRGADRQRPRQELDYINRLLKQF